MSTVTIPSILANFETSLSSKISSSATTLTLDRSTDVDGTTLAGTYSLTLDEGTSSEEHMVVTLAGSAGTITRRGLSRADAWTEVSASKLEHDRGASAKVTNVSQLNLQRLLRGDDAFDSPAWTGVASIAGLTTPGAGETTKAASVAYVNAVSIAGASDASATTKGIVELAVASEVTAGTATGATGAGLVATPNLIAGASQDSKWTYAADAGTTDAYAITLVPALAAYAAGQTFAFKANTANTTAATLNINGLGAKTIRKYANGVASDLETNDIIASMPVLVTYDGTYFVMHSNPATGLTSEIAYAVMQYNSSPRLQGIKTSFTTAEAVASGDLLDVTSADTVKRHAPTALPTTFDQTSTTAYTLNSGSGNQVLGQPFVRLSTTLAAAVYSDYNGALERMECFRIPITPSTGAIGALTTGNALTTAITDITTLDAVAMDSTRLLVCSSLTNSFSGGVINLTSAITPGTTVVIDTSNVSEGFCEYVSDSHVLFFSRDTSASSIQFYKYTASGTTLTASSTGTVTTLTGKTFTLKGVKKFYGTQYFLFIVQNTTDATAQALIAYYDTATSTFSTVGTLTSLTGSQQLLSTVSATAVFAQLSSTAMVVACPTSTTAGKYFLVYRSSDTSTTPLFGAINSMTARSASAGYSLTRANARCAYLNSTSTSTVTSRLLELNSAGTDISTRATSTPITSAYSEGFSWSFHANPVRMGIAWIDTAGDVDCSTGEYTLSVPVGIATADAASAATVDAVTSGYCSSVTGLTAATKYYADIGGLLTTESNNTPDKVGVTKDATEIIVKSW